MDLGERIALRPRHLEKKVSSGNRMVNNFKMVDMINPFFRAHAQDRRRHCHNLQVKILHEVKLRLAWKFKFQCQNCCFTSEIYKLYKEADFKDKNRGAAPAAMNLSLAVVLMDTPIGKQNSDLY